MSMKGFKFLDYSVYKDAKHLRCECQFILNLMRVEKQFSLKDQLERCLNSVILNIAEGSSRRSYKDFARFLEISLGSLNESVACVDLVFNLGIINKQKFLEIILISEKVAKQIRGLQKSLLLKIKY